jgi:hypothetical protein
MEGEEGPRGGGRLWEFEMKYEGLEEGGSESVLRRRLGMGQIIFFDPIPGGRGPVVRAGPMYVEA